MIRAALQFLYSASLVGVVVSTAAVLGVGGEAAFDALKCFLGAMIGSMATLQMVAFVERKNAAFVRYFDEQESGL